MSAVYEPIEALVDKLSAGGSIDEMSRVKDEILSRFNHFIEVDRHREMMSKVLPDAPRNPDPGPSPEERRRVWADALVRHGGSDYAEEYLAAFDARFPRGGAR